jgi:hypothetical protein
MKAQVLLIGAILTPGKRVVTQALRVMGLEDSQQFAQYHQVLSRAVWSPLALAQVLLRLLVTTFVPGDQPLVFGIDPTIERRWGRKITARGIYRDAVRSSDSHFVKTSGLRWVSLMLLTAIPWTQRVWALPVMTVLSPSERYYQQHGRAPKTLLERSWQMVKLLRRWWPTRALILVGDNAFAALDFLDAAQQQDVTIIARLRLDAALYAPAPPYSGKGRPRKKGQRLPTLATCLSDPATDWQQVALPWYDGQQRDLDIASHTAVWFHSGKPPVPIRWVLIRDPQGEYASLALLCTDGQQTPTTIVTWFVQRWQLEVPFEEARRHLGMETQRQWSDNAIARTTPLLLGLFSWVTLLAHTLYSSQPLLAPRQAAWYSKPLPTFSDALALVRQHLWTAYPTFRISKDEPDMLKIPKPLFPCARSKTFAFRRIALARKQGRITFKPEGEKVACQIIAKERTRSMTSSIMWYG